MSIVTSKPITLKGSATIITEFFGWCLCSDLSMCLTFNSSRRIRTQQVDFHTVKKYGINIMVSSDESVQSYLKQILTQVENWILAKTIARLVLVISSRETRTVLERWQFEIQQEESVSINDENVNITKASSQPKTKRNKTEKEIQAEIQTMLRQINASMAFLPLLEDACELSIDTDRQISTFNILAYTDKDAEVPSTWIDSDAKMIDPKSTQCVKLRGFSTSVHKLDGVVSFRLADED
ncbi:Mitotic spindle checkpoint component mad2, partial [Nowakowskiella sp. JEL0078]